MKRLIILFAGIVLTAVLSLSVHIVLQEVLHIPYPEGRQTIAGWALFGNFLLSTLGVIWLYRMSKSSLEGLALPVRCLIFFVLLSMLYGDLIRAPFMVGIVSSDWGYAMIQAIPQLLTFLMLTILVVPLAPRLHGLGFQIAAALLISLVVHFIWTPWVTQEVDRVLAMLPLPNRAAFLQMHDWRVLLAAYVTYGEPVIACLVLAKLVWNGLAKSLTERICQFAVLILLVRGLLFGPLMYALGGHRSFLTAFLSVSQFSLEALVLAALTAVTWEVYRTVAE